MTLDEVKKFFGSSYNFNLLTGWTHSCYNNWAKKGYIPIKSQFKIQEFTKGELKARIEDLGYNNDTARTS